MVAQVAPGAAGADDLGVERLQRTAAEDVIDLRARLTLFGGGEGCAAAIEEMRTEVAAWQARARGGVTP